MGEQDRGGDNRQVTLPANLLGFLKGLKDENWAASRTVKD